MNSRSQSYRFMPLFVTAGALLLAVSGPAFGQHHHSESVMPLDTSSVAQVVGVSGQLIAPEGIYKISVPRTDVKVTVDGLPMPPFMGLTTWVGFQPGDKPDSTMVMGDFVLFEDEVNPVMSALLEHGLSVTALHNHFFYAKPTVFFMHVEGDGNAVALTRGIRAALDAVHGVRSAAPQPADHFEHPAIATTSTITPSIIENAFHTKAMAQSGMVKVILGREATMTCGCKVGKDMGVNTWAAFMGSDNLAAVDGDFVAAENELQPVLRTLRKGLINIVAINNHMEGESPRLIFLHYWGVGTATELANTLESAVTATNEQRALGMRQ